LSSIGFRACTYQTFHKRTDHVLDPKIVSTIHFYLNKAFRKRTDHIFDADEYITESDCRIRAGFDGARNDCASMLEEDDLEEDDYLRVDSQARDVLVGGK
jgi:hypothetical protein